MNDMTPDQIKAMYAKQQNPNSPRLSISHLHENKEEKLNPHKKSRLMDFASKWGKKGIRQSGKSYGYASAIHGKGKEIKNNRTEKKQAHLYELENQVTAISEDTKTSEQEKISALVRLLNNNHKNIDQALHQRIKSELGKLHQPQPQQQSYQENDPFEPLGDPTKDERAINKLAGQMHEYQELDEYPYDDTGHKVPEETPKVNSHIQSAHDAIKLEAGLK